MAGKTSWYRDLLEDLRTLIHAGIPIAEALESLASERRGPASALAGSLAAKLRSGSTLSDALALHPRDVPPEHVALVAAGERSGALEAVLARVVEWLDRGREVRELFRKEASYPITVLVLAVILLPLPLLIFGSVWTYAGIQVCFFVPALTILHVVRNGPSLLAEGSRAREVFERTILATPWLGSLILEGSLGRVFRILSILIESGLSLRESIPLAAGTSTWESVRSELREVEPRIRAGESLTEALKKSPSLARRPSWTARIAVGEKAGSLDRSLGELGRDLENRARSRLLAAIRILPIPIFIIVGVLVLLQGLRTLSGVYRVE